MRFLEVIFTALLAAGALAAPFEELWTRQEGDVAESMAVDWSAFADAPVEVVSLEAVPEPDTLTKRKEKFDLKKKITLSWKNEDATAKMTGDYADASERVINMEDFGDELSDVDCTAPSMFMDFKTKGPFETAKQKWNWVNEKANNHFILFANHPKCGPRGQRVPYDVTNIRYDDKKFIVHLTAKKLNFKDAMKTGSIRVVAQTAPAAPTKRDVVIDDDEPLVYDDGNTTSLVPRWRLAQSGSIAKDFSGNIIALNTAGNDVRLDCEDCGTKGKMGVAFDASWGVTQWWPPKVGVKHAFFEFWGTNIEARMNVALSGKTAGTKSGSKRLFSFALFGLEIPNVLTLKFGPEFGVGYTVNMSGGGKLRWGARAALTPSSYYKLCFKGCGTTKTGWGVQVTRKDPSVTGIVHTSASLYSYTSLAAVASFFSWGYQAGAAARAPELVAKFDTLSGKGVCGNPAWKNGLQARIDAGLQTYAYLGTNPITPSSKWPIWSWYGNLLNKCYGWA